MDFHGAHAKPESAAEMQDMGLAEGIRIILQNMKQSSQLIIVYSTTRENMQIFHRKVEK